MSCDVAVVGAWRCGVFEVADGEAEGVGIHCKCHLRKWILKLFVCVLGMV